MAAELKQRDISEIQKLAKNMSPTKEVVMLLVQSIKWAYLIFVIFITQAKFLENKIYTEIYTVNCQFFALNL